MMEMVISQAAHSKELKIEDIPIIHHHLDHLIQIATIETFTIEGQTGHVISFTGLFHLSTALMSLLPPTLPLATWKHHHMPEKEFIKAIYYHPS